MKYSVQYEFPLNEFIRNSLKINRLMDYFVDTNINYSEINLRNLIARLLELHSLVSRAELKNELIKEIEKKHQKLSRLKKVANIDHTTLSNTIKHLEVSLNDLKNISSDAYSRPLAYLIDAIKQREFAPGGQFDFDLPAYKFWLCSDPQQCYREAMDTISEYRPITDTISMFLGLLRQSAVPKSCVAENGFLQLKDKHNSELLIVSLQNNQRIYPEISGGKHRVFIRFMQMDNIDNKPLQTKSDIEFSLKSCFI